LSNKIDESGCDIICLQETKRENFDLDYIKKFCPKKFNKFEYLPSIGASGDLLSFGMALCLMVKWLFKMNFLSQSSSLAI
jgi:hypothetical protein